MAAIIRCPQPISNTSARKAVMKRVGRYHLFVMLPMMVGMNLIGAPSANGNDGKAYLVTVSTNGTRDLSTSCHLTGQSGSKLGSGLANAGDLNNDGRDDFMILPVGRCWCGCCVCIAPLPQQELLMSTPLQTLSSRAQTNWAIPKAGPDH